MIASTSSFERLSNESRLVERIVSQRAKVKEQERREQAFVDRRARVLADRRARARVASHSL